MIMKLTPRNGKWNGIACNPTHVEIESVAINLLPQGWTLSYTDIESNSFDYSVELFDSIEVTE